MLNFKNSLILFISVIIVVCFTQCKNCGGEHSSGQEEKSPPVVDFKFDSGEDVPTRLFIQKDTPLPEHKPLFSINGKPFVPVIMHIVSNNLPDENDIQKLIQQGYNTLCLVLNYSEIGEMNLIHFIERCKERAIPLIIELRPNGLHDWLKVHKEGNMWFSPKYPSGATHIHYFPDYANPETWAEYQRQLKETLDFLKPYIHDPIISFSLGAYDHFHIPEGETHVDFTCSSEYPVDVKHQTWLPYGPFVEKEYLAWMNDHRNQFDLATTDELTPPINFEQAAGFEHWRSWIIYRRDYVRKWIEKTYNLVKEISMLPITMTYDVNFSIRDKFGSPPTDLADILDYVVIYLYLSDSTTNKEVALRMKGLDHLFRTNEIPMISLFEFTSQITNVPISAMEYLRQTAPYVSGMQYQIYSSFKGNELKDNLNRDFLKGIKDIAMENVLLASTTVPSTAIYLNPKEIFLWESGYHIGKELLEIDEDYDIIYTLDQMKNYKKIYIPFTKPVFQRDDELNEELDILNSQGKKVVLRDLTFYEL
jgi:hypothetical protein